MGPGNTSAQASGSASPPALGAAPTKSIGVQTQSSARRRAIAKRLGSKTEALAAGKLDNMPDDKTSFEGI